MSKTNPKEPDFYDPSEGSRKAYGAALAAIGERVAVTLAKDSAIREGSLVLPKTALMEGLVEAFELGCEAAARQEGTIAEMVERIKELEDTKLDKPMEPA